MCDSIQALNNEVKILNFLLLVLNPEVVNLAFMLSSSIACNFVIMDYVCRKNRVYLTKHESERPGYSTLSMPPSMQQD